MRTTQSFMWNDFLFYLHEKDKLWYRKKTFHEKLFSLFYTDQTKSYFSSEVSARTYNMDVYAQNFFRII